MLQQTFFVIGGNCSRSKQDAQIIFNYFIENGWKPVKKITKAAVICIYTCGGFNEKEQSSIRTILGILQQKSDHATVIVTGCLTKIHPESLKNFENIMILEFDRLDRLDSIIQATTSFTQIPNAGIIQGVPALYPEKKTKTFLGSLIDPNVIRNIPFYINKLKKIYLSKIRRFNTKEIYHVRISRGCLGSCSYCSIKLAHGRLQSRPLNHIQKDFEHGLKKGYKTFKIIGQDIGCYGLDINTSIVEVLKIFFNLPGENKIIITDFNPQWFLKYYDQLEPLLLAHHKKILALRIPIESGSNAVLERMNRHYKIEDVKRVISTLKEKLPTLDIYTHILVGFPGETDEDFQRTINLLKELQFSSVGIYSYSDRPMTESFTMKDKNSPEVIQNRIKQIKMMSTYRE